MKEKEIFEIKNEAVQSAINVVAERYVNCLAEAFSIIQGIILECVKVIQDFLSSLSKRPKEKTFGKTNNWYRMHGYKPNRKCRK